MKTRRYRTQTTVYICEVCGDEDTNKEWVQEHEKIHKELESLMEIAKRANPGSVAGG